MWLRSQLGVLVFGQVGQGHRSGMARGRGKGESAPMTLGQALAAKVRLIVWCKSCGHQAEPDVATQVAHHGATMPVSRLGALSALLDLRRARG